MASTDAKSGFRLPWSGDRNESEDQTANPGTEPAAMDPAQQQSENESETPTMIDSAPTPSGEAVQSEPAQEPEGTASPAPERKANKFMADLTRAMQAAAESARADTLERFAADAKSHIEAIHATTAEESAELRKRADDDIAGIREWSKTEIARIREETDERVTHRKEKLEREVEAHAAEIEARIERVQTRVAAFEAEMAAFFERLLAEDDPTRFASMAETLPEPPPFDAEDAWASVVGRQPDAVAEEPVAEATAETEAVDASPDVQAETSSVEATDASQPAETDTAPATADTGDLFGIPVDSGDSAPSSDADLRLAAIGVEPDFAAAEAEAAAFPAESPNPEDEIPTIAEDTLAARLAGLVPEDHSPPEKATTRVVVTGLVSVASIAGFKRSLARVSGVRSVGVSSGPDGEFVFAVTHDPGLALADGIASLSGFSARVTNEAQGELTVAARDPETES